MEIRVSVSPRRASWCLGSITALLVAASILGSLATAFLDLQPGTLWEVRQSWVRLFYLESEANVPAWFASMLLLGAGLLMAHLACQARVRQQPWAGHWGLMGAVFVLLSVDEVAVIHEMAMTPVRLYLHLGGPLYYAWILPGALLVAGFTVAYLRFWLCLPARWRWTLCAAAVVYVGGALGMEGIGGWRAEAAGRDDGLYAALVTTEEAMEMAGVVVLIHGLLGYAGAQAAAAGAADAGATPDRS